MSRPLSKFEQEASAKYNTLLTAFDNVYNVKSYDRVSVHAAFPELNEAFERIRATRTFYHLSKDYDE